MWKKSHIFQFNNCVPISLINSLRQKPQGILYDRIIKIEFFFVLRIFYYPPLGVLYL